MNIPLFDSKTILAPFKSFVTPLPTDTSLDLTPTLTIQRRFTERLEWGSEKQKQGMIFIPHL